MLGEGHYPPVSTVVASSETVQHSLFDVSHAGHAFWSDISNIPQGWILEEKKSTN